MIFLECGGDLRPEFFNMNLTLSIPLPPSINHYYKRTGSRVFISPEGRAFRAAVALEVERVLRREKVAVVPGGFIFPASVPVGVYPAFFMPDKRRRDLDNFIKPLLDALQCAPGFLEDDKSVYWLIAHKAPPHEALPDGGCLVNISDEVPAPE